MQNFRQQCADCLLFLPSCRRSDKVPVAAHSGGGFEDERSPDSVPRHLRSITPKPSTIGGIPRPGSRSRSASPALSALAPVASPAAVLAARVASPSPLKPLAPSPLRPAAVQQLGEDIDTAAPASAASSSSAGAAQPEQQPPQAPHRQTAAAEHGAAADAADPHDRTEKRAAGWASAACTEEAVMSAAAAMLKESTAAPDGSGSHKARLAVERMVALEPQARSRVIAAGVRASIPVRPAPDRLLPSQLPSLPKE